MIQASAPGKVILVGEHAVVYGRPALAVPVWETVATATITPAPPDSGCTIHAQDTGMTLRLDDAPVQEPLALVARLALAAAGAASSPNIQIVLSSDIPIASGLGSGAALSAALVRALFQWAGCAPDPTQISRIVFESEKVYHGTPSGIDNNVVAYGVPIWFVRGETPVPIGPQRPFMLVIADSGQPGITRETVGRVRAGWQADPAWYEERFDEIGTLVLSVRRAVEGGDTRALGNLFTRNHQLLSSLGVSTPHLDDLVEVARLAGAYGAKLSGGGGGGNIIAAVEADLASTVADALLAGGATRTIVTTVSP